jgi:hypothetical protein
MLLYNVTRIKGIAKADYRGRDFVTTVSLLMLLVYTSTTKKGTAQV